MNKSKPRKFVDVPVKTKPKKAYQTVRFLSNLTLVRKLIKEPQ